MDITQCGDTSYQQQQEEQSRETVTEEASNGGDSSSTIRPPQSSSTDLVVLGPPGTRPQVGKTLARYDDAASVVYSRSSSQLLVSGSVPNTSMIVVKDSCAKLRRGEVTVILPSDVTHNRRWTRAGTRVIDGTHQSGVNYLEESFSSSQFSSSSDEEKNVFRVEIEKTKKKRTRRKRPQSHNTRAGHGSLKRRERKSVALAELISSAEEDEGKGEEDGGQAIEELDIVEEGGWEEGAVQMEYEIGNEDEDESPTPPLVLKPTQQTPFKPSTKKAFSYPAKVCTVYENLEADKSIPSVIRSKSDGVQRVVGMNCKKVLRPCSVNITGLPQHIIHRFLQPQVKKSPSAVVESIVHVQLQGDSMSATNNNSTSSSSSSSSSGSDSESMLVDTRKSRRNTSPNNTSGTPRSSMVVTSTTPRRLSSNGWRSPVARRSFPFSKPPNTTSTNTTSYSPTSETVHSTTTPLSPKSPPTSPSNQPKIKPVKSIRDSVTTPTRPPINTRLTPASSSRSRPVQRTTPSFARKSTGGSHTVAVDWSSDDDFDSDPSPSFIISPTCLPKQSPSPVLHEKRSTSSSSDGGKASKSRSICVISTPSLDTSISPHPPSNSNSNPTSPVITEEGNDVKNTKRAKNFPPVQWKTPTLRAVAHSLTEDATESGMLCVCVCVCV